MRLIGITGVGGYGKSALAAQMYEQLEQFQDKFWANFQEPVSFSTFGRWLWRKIEGDETYTKTYGLLQSLSDEDLETELINRLSRSHYLLVMDNLETLLSVSSWQSYQRFFEKWLRCGSGGLLLITSQRHIDLEFRNRCRWLTLPGLSVQAGLALLKALKIRGSEEHLSQFVKISDGHPLLMTLAANWISQSESDKRGTDIYTLSNNDLALFTKVVGSHRNNPQASVGAVLEQSLQSVDATMRTLLMRASVYRYPFTTKMARAVSSSKVKEHEIKRSLVKRAFLTEQKINGQCFFRFQPLIHRYVSFRLREEESLIEVHKCAIAYYDGLAKSKKRHSEEEILKLLEIVYHGCEAGESEHAAVVLNHSYNYLRLRGHYRVLKDYYEIVIAKLQSQSLTDPTILGAALGHLANVYQSMSRYDVGIETAQKALKIYEEEENLEGQVLSLTSISNSYTFKGRDGLEQGRLFAQKAIALSSRLEESTSARAALAASLRNIGLAYDYAKQFDMAIEIYQEALDLSRSIENPSQEAIILESMGNVYSRPQNPGKDYSTAVQIYKQALKISKAGGFRNSEAAAMCDLGIICNKRREWREAIDYLEPALKIFEEIGNRRNELTALENLSTARGMLNRQESMWNMKAHLRSLQYLNKAKQIRKEFKKEGVSLDVWNPLTEKFFDYQYGLLDCLPIDRFLDDLDD